MHTFFFSYRPTKNPAISDRVLVSEWWVTKESNLEPPD